MAEPDPVPPAPSASSLDRLTLVLDAFAGRPALTLTEVVRSTGIPRTSTLRMLERLVRLGWLRRSGTHYELGERLARIGALALHRDRLDLAVAPVLRGLHRATGCVVHLGVLDGADVLYLDKVGEPGSPMPPTRAGGRVPARLSTIGKAVLGAAGPDPRPAFGTCAGGYGCIGVPVGRLDGAGVGLSVSGPPDRLAFDRRHVAPVLVAAVALAQHFRAGPAGLPVTGSAG